MSEEHRVASAAPAVNSPALRTTFRIDPSEFGVPLPGRISVRVSIRDERSIEFRVEGERFVLHVVRGGTVDDCFESVKTWWCDAIVNKVRVGDSADLMFAGRSHTNGVWIAHLTRTDGAWQCRAIKLNHAATVDTSYALTQGAEQVDHISRTHAAFMTLMGDDLLGGRKSCASGILLRIKVAPQERWLLRFPFGVFARFGLKGFDRYSACQFTVTKRSVSAVAWRQHETERELSNTSAFLAGTYVVLNTYALHASAASADMVRDGFSLLVELLEQLTNIPFPGGPIGLKWTVNPRASELDAVLRSPDTSFVFGDFEAAGGRWSLGDNVGGTFDLGSMRGQLEHIRLMRIFHCNSLYDPGGWRSEPVDDGTLAATLLATGAFFVEGSVTAEPVVDFVCTMLLTLLGRADLKTILFGRSLEGACGPAALISRANVILSQRGFQTIA